MVTRRRKRKSDLVDNFLPASQQRGLDTDLALSVLFEFLLLINANSFFFLSGIEMLMICLLFKDSVSFHTFPFTKILIFTEKGVSKI